MNHFCLPAWHRSSCPGGKRISLHTLPEQCRTSWQRCHHFHQMVLICNLPPPQEALFPSSLPSNVAQLVDKAVSHSVAVGRVLFKSCRQCSAGRAILWWLSVGGVTTGEVSWSLREGNGTGYFEMPRPLGYKEKYIY